MTKDPIVIVGAARTPIGCFQGELASVAAPGLGSVAIRAALEQANGASLPPDEVLMGCVLGAGLGQGPARQAALGADLPDSVACTTVNKVCASGMKTIMFAHDMLAAGSADLVVAGGMESMSGAPYLLPKARQGYRFGHGQLLDHMAYDGLEDAFETSTAMGILAERTAQAYQLTREEQDAVAITSLERAKAALADGVFDHEVAPVEVTDRKGQTSSITQDELPRRADPDRIPRLKPVFQKDGTITAASSSAISDGAAALALTRRSVAEAHSFEPMAEIVGHAGHAQKPETFTTAPVGAIRKLLERVGWSPADVDLFEINEAFALSPLIAIRELGLDAEKVNIHGGACALGHPIGASGSRILVTLLRALEKHGLKRGVASLCIGGGEATAVAIERV